MGMTRAGSRPSARGPARASPSSPAHARHGTRTHSARRWSWPPGPDAHSGGAGPWKKSARRVAGDGHDAHRHPGEARWQGRRMDGAGCRRAVSGQQL